MPQTQERTKSDIIREVLAELGCLTENPPTGWHDRVTRALKRQKITAHPTMIYDLEKFCFALFASLCTHCTFST